jgi:hypothetical protein
LLLDGHKWHWRVYVMCTNWYPTRYANGRSRMNHVS